MMTRVRCPQEKCIFWVDGWCDSDEIELNPTTLACITFEELEVEHPAIEIDDGDLEWEEDESIFEDELDERLYDYDDDDEEEDEEETEDLVADDEWSL